MVTVDFFETLNQIPLLADLPPALRKEMADSARSIRVDAGTTAYMRGQKPTSLALVVKGDLRIFTADDAGREVTLYHTDNGCFCLVNAISVISGKAVDATAYAESDCDVILFPTEKALRWMRESPEFNRLIMSIFADRIVSLLNLVGNLAFRHVDDRLIEFLVKRSEALDDSEMKLTHEQIARELGTAREVVSRILKRLEKDGLVRLGRGTVRITDLEELRAHLDPA